ncbi:MAG: BamA/TamA family outer membrane protein [Candidatus Aminicenantales bacterium]
MKFLRNLFFFLGLSALASLFCLSQSYYFPYYGKNKVLYERFNWKSYATDHFQIYFYSEVPQVLKNIAEMAESAYQKISEILKHSLSSPVPIIYYKTFTDFEQTNMFWVSEGVLGASEPALNRIGLHGDMPLDEIQSLVEHELGHIFEFDVLWGSPEKRLYAMNVPPLWVFEGLSEYVTQKWSLWSTLIVRDAALNDRIPDFTEAGELYSRYPLPREPAYDFGHAIYEFMESKYGKNSIREFLLAMKNIPLFGRKDSLGKVFDLKLNEFSFEFKKYLRQRVKEFYLRENPEDYSIPLGPLFPLNPYYFAFSHTLSPSGDLVATITYNIHDYDVDIVLLSTKDGSIVKNITRGYTSQYEYIKIEIDPSLGRNLAWSPGGDRIVFFARDGEKYSLFIIEALKGILNKKIPISVDQPCAPCFSPGGGQILFTGFQNGQRDIFQLDLLTEEIKNLTEDSLYEKAPAISPDGKYVAYTIRMDIYDTLFLSPSDNLKKKIQLTFEKGNTISPQFSSDSREIYFSGDMRDAYNIYSLNLESGELKRYTDVRTGNFFPAPLPNKSNELVFSSFNKGAFQLFKSEFQGTAEGTLPFAENGVLSFTEYGTDEEMSRLSQYKSTLTLKINQENIQPHKGIGKLYLTSRPPIGAIVSTDGTIMGGATLAFSDILGDHYFIIEAYQMRSFRSHFFSYINQKRRFQFMASIFQYTEFYYPDYTYLDPTLWHYLTYRDAIAYRKISGLAISAYYPLNKYYRAEANLGYYSYEEEFLDPSLIRLYSAGGYGYFLEGKQISASFSLTGETTLFNPIYGPKAGSTFRLIASQAVPISSDFIQNTTIQADLRKYLHLGADIVLAFRLDGFLSRGKNPFIFYYGGNNEVRSSYFNNIIATECWFANAELRFPLIATAISILGQIGPVRGVLFFDITRAKFNGFPAKITTFLGEFNPGDTGIREDDAIGSFGYGIEFYFLGLPLHLEFAQRLSFPDLSNPFKFDSVGKYKIKFWIGFDF